MNSAQTDRFVHDRLPPPAQWPELRYDTPELKAIPAQVNLVQHLFDRAFAHGHADRPFLRSDARTLTYAQAREQVCAVYMSQAPSPLRASYRRLMKALVAQAIDNATGQNSGRILSPRGSVIFEQRTNQLFVTDIPSKLQQVQDLIAKLDIPIRQVIIEARIVEADDSFGKSLGVRLGGGVRGFGVGSVNGNAVQGNFGSTYGAVSTGPTQTSQPFVSLPANPSTALAASYALSLFSPRQPRLEPRLMAQSFIAGLLRWPPQPLLALQHELHNRFGIDLRQIWAFTYMRRAFLPVLLVVLVVQVWASGPGFSPRPPWAMNLVCAGSPSLVA